MRPWRLKIFNCYNNAYSWYKYFNKIILDLNCNVHLPIFNNSRFTNSKISLHTNYL